MKDLKSTKQNKRTHAAGRRGRLQSVDEKNFVVQL